MIIKTTKGDRDIKVCPDCGGNLIIRWYTEAWYELEVDPVTGEQGDVIVESGDFGETDDYRVDCVGGCGFEAPSDEEIRLD